MIEDIIKRLNSASFNILCLGCEFKEDFSRHCFQNICRDAINTIETQQVTIEKLQKNILKYEDIFVEQQAEIERLTINMNAFGLGMKRESERADTIRAEAIKEFAKELKESNHGTLSYCTGWVDFDDIDNLVKEMVGEQG